MKPAFPPGRFIFALLLVLCLYNTLPFPALASEAALTTLYLHNTEGRQFPIFFEQNLGQHGAGTFFWARSGGHTFSLQTDKAVLTLHQAAQIHQIEMIFRGSNPQARLAGSDPLSGKVNYLIGREPRDWRTAIPIWRKVSYTQIYPGIDLEFYANRQDLEYDFIVAPGTAPQRIDLSFTGVDAVRVDADGNLHLLAGDTLVVQKKPVIYQEVDGSRVSVDGGYELRDGNRVGFKVAAYDSSRSLVIDPAINFSSYFGGSASDSFGDMALDAQGNIYLAGITTSVNFPGSYGQLQPELKGASDLFVAKFDPTGTSLLFSTYLGGKSDEWGQPDIAVDKDGNVYVTGITGSTDFPVSSSAFQTVLADSSASFLAKLNPTGSHIVYATLLDAVATPMNEVIITDLAVDLAGHAYVTGYTNSRYFPTTAGALKDFLGGMGYCGVGTCNDAFVTKFNLTGSGLIYSTYLGDANPGGFGPWGQNDRAFALAVDSAGNAYVTGNSNGPAYPVTPGAVQTEFKGGGMFGEYGDAFISKLDATGSHLVYSSYLGGSMLAGETVGGVDFGFGIAVDSRGNAYVVGSTSSKDFPVTPSAYQHELNFGGTRCSAAWTTDSVPCPDAFVAKLDPTGSVLSYATYLGGLDYDSGKSIAVDAAGVVYVAGGTDSTDFPLTADALQAVALGGGYCGTVDACAEVFAVKLDVSGGGLVYSTYLGGSGGESLQGVAIEPDNMGSFCVAGDTESMDFPLYAPYQSTISGRDVFLTKFGEPTPLNDAAKFVGQLYRDFLSREADPEGLAYWVGQLSSGAVTRASAAEAFLLSPEFGERIAPVVRLYFAYFKRIPDFGGLIYWVNEYSAGRRTLGSISDFFAGSTEFQETYGNLGDDQYVHLIYQNVLNREPDPEGLDFWTEELTSGRRSRGQVMVGFSESPEYRQLQRNPVYVTMVYVGLLRRAPDPDGFDYWVGAMSSGLSGQVLIQTFLSAEEYVARMLATRDPN